LAYWLRAKVSSSIVPPFRNIVLSLSVNFSCKEPRAMAACLTAGS
jgi:hypothetical protein